MTLQEICEVSWRQIFPNPSDESAVSKEEFISTGKIEFAYFTWLAYLNEKNQEGYAETPSYLLSEAELDVVDGVMDISSIKVFKSLPQDVWLQNIGGTNCHCAYIKSSLNLSQLLCDDDSLPDSSRTYYIVGKSIKFPKGVHKSPLSITYANMGQGVKSLIEVDEAIGAQIRDKLNAIYLGKTPPADETNNSNSNT